MNLRHNFLYSLSNNCQIFGTRIHLIHSSFFGLIAFTGVLQFSQTLFIRNTGNVSVFQLSNQLCVDFMTQILFTILQKGIFLHRLLKLLLERLKMFKPFCLQFLLMCCQLLHIFFIVVMEGQVGTSPFFGHHVTNIFVATGLYPFFQFVLDFFTSPFPTFFVSVNNAWQVLLKSSHVLCWFDNVVFQLSACAGANVCKYLLCLTHFHLQHLFCILLPFLIHNFQLGKNIFFECPCSVCSFDNQLVADSGDVIIAVLVHNVLDLCFKVAPRQIIHN